MKTMLTQYDSDTDDYEEVLPDNEKDAMDHVIKGLLNSKPKFSRVASSSGTKRVGFIGATFQEIHKVLGKPKKLKRGSDSTYAWDFKLWNPSTEAYQTFSIYDKDLKEGVSAEDNVIWNVAGSTGSHIFLLEPLFPKATLAKDYQSVAKKIKTTATTLYKEVAAPSGIPSPTKKAIKQTQDSIRKVREKRDVDLKNASMKIQRLQEKVNTLKFQNTPKKESAMSTKYNALARLQMASKKIFFPPYSVDVWREGNNFQISVTDAADKEVWSISDDAALQFVKDGFAGKHGKIDEDTVIDYLRDVGILPKHDVTCLVNVAYAEYDGDDDSGESTDSGFLKEDEEMDFEELVRAFKNCDDFSSPGASSEGVWGSWRDEDYRTNDFTEYSIHYSRSNRPEAKVLWTAAMKKVRGK